MKKKLFNIGAMVVIGALGFIFFSATPAEAALLFDGSVAPSNVNDLGFNDPDAGVQRLAEDFSFTESVIVNTITFLGGYYPRNTPETDLFTLTIYNDDMGLPNPLSVIAQIGIGDFGRTDTGADVFGIDLYSYTTSFASLPLSGNTLYWLTIVNNTMSDTNDDWVWAGDANVGNFARSFDGGVTWFDAPPGSFSFSLEGTTAVPVPCTMFLFGTGIVGLFGYNWQRTRKLF